MSSLRILSLFSIITLLTTFCYISLWKFISDNLHFITTMSKSVVLITGANSGIGRETVKALLQSTATYHVLLGTRDLEKGQEALESLRKEVPETSSTVELLQVDISSDDSITSAFDKVQAAHGRIDVLVNNAG